MALGEAAEACLLALQAWLLALATTALACWKLAAVASTSLLGLPGVQLTYRLARRVAPSWALGSAARPPAALRSAAAAGRDGPVPSAEPPAAPEQPESPQQPLAAGSPPQPRRRSSAVLRASSTELEPIAENVAEEAGWGGAEWWRPEEVGEEQVEPPYTRLTSLSLPASTELPGAAEAGAPLPANLLIRAAQSLEEEPLLQKAPTSSSPILAAEEASALHAAQQAQQAAEAAATAFAAEVAAAAGSPAAGAGAGPSSPLVKRPPSVENAEGADALLRGSGSAATPAAGEGSAGPAGGSGHGSPAAVPVGTPLLPEAVAEEALLPAEIEPALPPAELPPSLPPAEIEPAQLPAELPPALPPMPAEAAVELPVVQLAGVQYAPGDTSSGTSGGTGGGTSAALLSGAMLRSPPRGLEEEEPSVAEGGGGSPLSVPTAGAALASRSLPMDVAAAGAGGSAPVHAMAPGLQGAILESLVEGLPSAVPPPQPLPLRPPSPPAASGFQAAVAALGSGGPAFAADGGKLAAPFQLRGDGGSGAAGNPFGPATPSIDRGAPPAPAEPADQASPPALPPPPPASRAGTAFTRELAAAAADLVDGTAPG